MPGEIVTLLCGRCSTVEHIDLAVLDRVPLWLALIAEALEDAGVRAIRVQSCDTCLDLYNARGAEGVLKELKRRIEGR